VEIVVAPTQTLQGVVTSSVSARALDRFYLSVQPEAGEPRERRSRRQATQWQGWIRAPDGRFELTVMPGRYQVVVKAPAHRPRVLDGVVVEELVPPGPLDIVLDAGGGIEGTLRDPEGKPVASAGVHARLFRGGAAEQGDWVLGADDQTDDRGRFFLEGLGPGSYVVQANMGSRGSATARVSVAGAEMARCDLALLPTGTVRVKAVDGEGKPVAGIHFQFMEDEQTWVGWAPPTGQDGESRSQPMRAGPATLKAQDRQQQWVADDVRVEILPGRAITVEVVMKRKEGGAGGG
jgi:hypothetical protein